MFYGNIILGKKGPLAKLWLAAHWEKKLSKAHVVETDVPSAVDNLISPSVKIALRTSGHLLLGVVRIYSRKTKYLLADCSEAFVKIKMAFRPGLVDLPEDNREAAVSAITLPEFQEWDAIVNDLSNFDLHAQITLNQSRVEEITMKEDLFGSNFILDDNFFGDTPFGEVNEKELLRDASTLVDAEFQESDVSKVSIVEDDEGKKKDEIASMKENQLALEEPMQEEGFGMGEGLDFLVGFQEGEGIVPDLEELMEADKEKDVSEPTLEPLDINMTTATIEDNADALPQGADKDAPFNQDETVQDVAMDQTTLIMNQDEAFSLEPIEMSAFGKKKPKRRKRKLVVDDEKILKGDQIRAQLEDTSDIVVAASVAPPTKLRMRLMETSTVKYLFSMPAVELYSEKLLSAYTRHLTADAVEDLDVAGLSEQEEIELSAPELEEIEPTDKVEDEVAAPEAEAGVQTTEATENAQAVEEPENISNVDNLFVDVTQGLVDDQDDPEVEPADSISSGERSGGFEDNDDLIDDKDDDAQERRWTKRTHQMLNLLEREFRKKDQVHLSHIIRKKDSRKQAACLFSTVLILRKEKGIATEQAKPCDDIIIMKGSRFDELL